MYVGFSKVDSHRLGQFNFKLLVQRIQSRSSSMRLAGRYTDERGSSSGFIHEFTQKGAKSIDTYVPQGTASIQEL